MAEQKPYSKKSGRDNEKDLGGAFFMGAVCAMGLECPPELNAGFPPTKTINSRPSVLKIARTTFIFLY